MFSRKYDTLFVHIPKTGGQSITEYFLSLENVPWKHGANLKYLEIVEFEPLSFTDQLTTAHFTMAEYKCYYHPKVIDSSIKFAIVRDPLTRAFSEYNYNWADKVSWDEFATKKFIDKIRFYHDNPDIRRHLEPQYIFVDDETEILRFENLEQDFKDFCLRHELPVGKLPKRNKGPNKVPPSRGELDTVYKLDKQIFGYGHEF